MSRHRIEDGGNSPADIIKRIERARRADSTREGLASAYRRLDEALIKADGRYTQRALTVLPRLGFQVIVSAPESKTGEILEVSTKAYVTYKDPDTGLTSLREAVLHQNDMDDESSSDILKDDGVAE